MNPRILFISTAIPPHPESQTIRNLFFLKGLKDINGDLTIVSAECEEKDNSLTFLMPQCKLLRTPRPSYFKIKKRLGSFPLGRYWQWLYGIYANFGKIPDLWSGWDRIVISKIVNQISRSDIDIIVTSSGSYTAHIAGAYLAKEWAKPWVAELGDPWTKNPIWPANFFFRVWRNQKLEMGSIPRADALVLTTEATADCYRKWLGPQAPPIAVIPMGYEPAEFLDVTPAVGHDNFKIAYIGVAYRTGRDLRPLMNAIIELKQFYPVHFRMIGPCSSSYHTYAQRDASNLIEFLGRVDYKQSLEYIKKEDILVAIGNTGGMQIPGKIYMYLASGRPILYISQSDSKDDPSWQLLQRFPGVYRCPNRKEEIMSTLGDMLADFNSVSPKAFSRITMPELTEYAWPSLGRRFGQLIMQILQKNEERK